MGMLNFLFSNMIVFLCVLISSNLFSFNFTPNIYVSHQVADCSNSSGISTSTLARKLSKNAIIQKVRFTYIFLAYGSKNSYLLGSHFYNVFGFSFSE